MVSVKNIANAVDGRTARACDSCIHKRARWYCAADDAFLCRVCDASVHSANPLARRHERVRLKTSSLRLSLENFVPSWHKGFTKKARTPRHKKQQKLKYAKEPRKNLTIPSVPELSIDENSHEEKDEQELLYRVPSCDPFLSEQCCMSGNSKDLVEDVDHADTSKLKSSDLSVNNCHYEVDSMHDLILPSELDMVEFAADVESLLGKKLDDSSLCMESLGLMEDFRDAENSNFLELCCPDDGKIKFEQEHSGRADKNSDTQMARKPFEFSFDFECPATSGDEEVKPKNNDAIQGGEIRERIALNLDYEAIIAAWSIHETPWFTGDGPCDDINKDWNEFRGISGTPKTHLNGGFPSMSGHIDDGRGREARVSRYREKRRTRLFSKKIRYQVRKLNADKRPRIKGRFVKRAAFSTSVPFTLLSN